MSPEFLSMAQCLGMRARAQSGLGTASVHRALGSAGRWTLRGVKGKQRGTWAGGRLGVLVMMGRALRDRERIRGPEGQLDPDSSSC